MVGGVRGSVSTGCSTPCAHTVSLTPAWPRPEMVTERDERDKGTANEREGEGKGESERVRK